MKKNGLISSTRVAEVNLLNLHLVQETNEQAMKKVDRKNYVLDETKAYEDSPQ